MTQSNGVIQKNINVNNKQFITTDADRYNVVRIRYQFSQTIGGFVLKHLESSVAFTSPRIIVNGDTTEARREQLPECPSKVSTHGTVDDEVDRVADDDDNVNEKRNDTTLVQIEDVKIEGVVNNKEDKGYGRWQFNDQKQSDNGDDEQCASVNLRQFSTL